MLSACTLPMFLCSMLRSLSLLMKQIVKVSMTQNSRMATQRESGLNWQSRVRLLKQRHLSATPRSRGVGTPRVPGPLATSLRGLWVSASCRRAMVDKAEGRRPRTDHVTKGADSELPGWQPKETASQLPQERGTLETAWVASVHKREGPQRPKCAKGRGPKDPDVAAPLAAAGCLGNCWEGRPTSASSTSLPSWSTASLTVTSTFPTTRRS